MNHHDESSHDFSHELRHLLHHIECSGKPLYKEENKQI